MLEKKVSARGVVAAGSSRTAEAGARMLARGGNAVDAAVAAAFASFIAEIGFVHLGGSGLAQLYLPQQNSTMVYDFFSTAPGLGGSTDQPIDFHAVQVNYGQALQEFHVGRGAVAVPGNIFGLCELSRDWGRLTLREQLEPAMELARDGVVLDSSQAQACKILQPLFLATPGMRRIFAPRDRLITEGERLWIPDLAETLEEISDRGAESLRNGRLGEALLRDQQQKGGRLTQLDLDSYRVLKHRPVAIDYRDCKVLFPPPSSMGGPLTAFALRLLADIDLACHRPASAARLQALIEVLALTSEARRDWNRWCDRESPEWALDKLLSADFVKPYLNRLHGNDDRRGRKPLPPEPRGPTATSHLGTIDRDGMAVSLTTTAGESAGHVVAGTGLITNNMMGEADLHPHGFHQSIPGERLLTMMTPLLAFKKGSVYLVVGSAGSTRIRSAILQVLSNSIDGAMSLSDAVQAPRLHLEGDVLHCEPGLPAATLAKLASPDYRLNLWSQKSLYFGGTHCLVRLEDGELAGSGDSRRSGAVAVG